MVVQIINTLDLIDDRTALIDAWASFDGVDNGVADAQVWARQTDDDPGGAPTWSAWERLDAGEFEARGVDFQARLTSLDPTFNIHVSELTVNADEVQ